MDDSSVTGLLMEQHSAVQDYDYTEEPPTHLREEQQEIVFEKDDYQEFITFRQKKSPKEDRYLDLDRTNYPTPKDQMCAASDS